MKLRKLLAQLGLAAVLLSTLNLQLSTALAQGTAFTYQGRLDVAGVPANGTNDLTFTLYDAVSAGATVGTSNTVNDLVITNGLFTVTLDFGAGAFNGAARWLQIAARPGVSTGAYTNLAPRQAITPAPYAIFAGGASAAGVTGTLPAAALTGVNGSGLTSLNASNLASGTVSDARLSTNVALLNRSPQTFTGGINSFSGNVGIGTPSPSHALEVQTPQTGGLAVAARLTNPTTGDNNGNSVGLLFSVEAFTEHGKGALAFERTASHARGKFHVLQNNVASAVSPSLADSVMTIDNTGQVGLGTTTPAALLDLSSSAAVGERLRLSGNDYAGNGNFPSGISLVLQRNISDRADLFVGYSPALASNGTNTGLRIIPGGSPTSPQTAGVTRLDSVSTSGGVMRDLSLNETIRILGANGNVGIGTTTPGTPLEVRGSTTIRAAGSNPLNVGLYLDCNHASGVWSIFSKQDDGGLQFHNPSTGTHTMYFKPNGNVGLGTISPATRLDVAGEVTCVAVNITSDRNAKEDFKPVSGREVLAKVAALPITEWQYKTQGDARHIGPMAQDFRAAFGTGRDEKHIASVDADGVALAAIQGLHELVQEKSAEVESLKQSVAELKELVRQLTQPAGR